MAEGFGHEFGFAEEDSFLDLLAKMFSEKEKWLELKYFNSETNIPAIIQLMSHILQIAIAHIIHAKHKAVLVLGHSIANVLEQLVLLLARLLGDLGQVEDLGSS